MWWSVAWEPLGDLATRNPEPPLGGEAVTVCYTPLYRTPLFTENILPHSYNKRFTPYYKKTEGNFNHTEGNFTLTEGRRTLILDKKRLKIAKFAQSVSKCPNF